MVPLVKAVGTHASALDPLVLLVQFEIGEVIAVDKTSGWFALFCIVAFPT